VRLVSDVGRVQTKAGTQAALDGLKLAEAPREMTRIAALAEKKGGKTRAILKTLGRGAILLSIASFNLAAWVLRRDPDAVRLRVLGQSRGRARDVPAPRPQEGTPGHALRHDGAIAGLNLRVPGLYPFRMPVFHHGAVELACLDEGQGEPIVLVHGFGSSKR
jgi:hypothetical protein